MRILLDIDGTIATWDSVAQHGFGPATRPFDPRTEALIRQHAVTLFSQNPEIVSWGRKLGCDYLVKPPPGSPTLSLTEFEVLIDDCCEQFAYHVEGIQCFLTLDDFFREYPLNRK